MSTLGVVVVLLNVTMQFAIMAAICWFVLSNWFTGRRLIISSTASAAALLIAGTFTSDFFREDRLYVVLASVLVAVVGTTLWLRRYSRSPESQLG